MKKGFTLVELLITIGLIALVGTLVVSNMSSTFVKQQDEQFQLFKDTIQNAACTYVELQGFRDKYGANKKASCKSSSCTVKVGDLLNEGLIDEDDLKNPKTQDYISLDLNVTISYPSGVKTCTLSI